jgi:transglutaminase-like putative cysteine protease
MRYLILLSSIVLGFQAASADSEFVGMFMQGKRIGYMRTTITHEPAGTRTISASHINATILGSAMQLDMTADSLSKGGLLTKQVIVIESGGRSQRITATYGKKAIDIVRVADGATDKKSVPIPEGALIMDDPTFGIVGKGMPKAGTKLTFYSLDPMLLVLVKNEALFKGPASITVDNKQVDAFLVEVSEPRSTTSLYLDVKGEFVYAKGLLGITMKPITREEALGNADYAPEIDIADASRVVPDKPIENHTNVTGLTLQLKGGELKRLKSDYYQTVTRVSPEVLTLKVHPVVHDAAAPKKAMEEFRGPGLDVPSDEPEFKDLAKKVFGSEKDQYKAALAVSKYVNSVMRPKTNVGMVRDAREIWKTKEGVCRDYATLACTILRAGDVPCKVVSGSVYSAGAFYYHAWIEAWDGSAWIAFDPTLGGGLADATHLKFAEGDPDKAFAAFTFDGVTIKVIDVQRSK